MISKIVTGSELVSEGGLKLPSNNCWHHHSLKVGPLKMFHCCFSHAQINKQHKIVDVSSNIHVQLQNEKVVF